MSETTTSNKATQGVTTTQTANTENGLQIKDILRICLKKWYWFIIAVAIAVAASILYVKSQTPVYTRNASLQIKNEKNGGNSVSSLSQSFSDMGLISGNSNVYNEMAVFKSYDVLVDVVREMCFNVSYSIKTKFNTLPLYGSNLPITVEFADRGENEFASLTVSLASDSTFTLSDFIFNEQELNGIVEGRIGQSITTPIGQVIVKATEFYGYQPNIPLIYVTHSSLSGTTRRCLGNLTVTKTDKNADVITLSFSDTSIRRADDFLTKLIDVYNRRWIQDKNLMAISSEKFIDERLNLIEQDLSNVDINISTYKSQQLLPDINAAANMYMQQSSTLDAQIRELNTQLYMAQYIRDYMTNSDNEHNLLPSNSGIGSQSIESQITQFNTAVLARNRIASTSSDQNVVVVEYDQNIKVMRQAIVTSIDNQIVSLNNQIKTLRKKEEQTTARIAANPTQAKTLLDAERQQKVKEALYIFLLQKREENELSKAFTAYNTRIIQSPGGSNAPTSPQSNKILLIAILLGLALPFGVLYLKEVTNTKLRGREDLKSVTIPFLGEIPLAWKEKKSITHKIIKLILPKKKSEDQNPLVVKSGNRNVINEAFRVLRTNIEFINEKSSSSVIIFTSFNPGSGKSFISVNTGASLAIKNKKVIILDGDLRHASLSKVVNSPKTGISNYLARQINDWESLIVPVEQIPGLFILPVGTIPPNPTELIADDRFGDLINELKARYDYVLIDCPPIDIVADTQIIEKYADRTCFIVRSGVLERAMIPELENLYKEGKYKDMALILNGTTPDNSHYGYRYGYRYGYHYGYHSYGYYGSDDDSKGSRRKKHHKKA